MKEEGSSGLAQFLPKKLRIIIILCVFLCVLITPALGWDTTYSCPNSPTTSISNTHDSFISIGNIEDHMSGFYQFEFSPTNVDFYFDSHTDTDEGSLQQFYSGTWNTIGTCTLERTGSGSPHGFIITVTSMTINPGTTGTVTLRIPELQNSGGSSEWYDGAPPYLPPTGWAGEPAVTTQNRDMFYRGTNYCSWDEPPGGNISGSPLCSGQNIVFNFTSTQDYGTQSFSGVLYNNNSFWISFYDAFDPNPYYTWTWSLPPGDYQLEGEVITDIVEWSGWYNFTVTDCLWKPTLNSTYDWRNATNITEFSPEDWNFEIGLNRTEIEDMVNASVIPDAIIESVFNMWDYLLNPLVSGLTSTLGIINYPLTMITQVFDDFESSINTYDTEFTAYLGFWIQIFNMIFSILPDSVEFVLCGGLVLMGTKIVLER